MMYALKNKVQLIGNLGNSPDVRTLESGRKMARFSMATSESYRNAQGERVTDTQWHNLIVWGKLADIAERFLVKGKEVAVEIHRLDWFVIIVFRGVCAAGPAA